jgi:predicted CXXCH cytochrome family protein
MICWRYLQGSVPTCLGRALSAAIFCLALVCAGANLRAQSVACAECHAGVWQSYRQSGMARSFFRPRPENTVEEYAHGDPYYHRASATYYAMVRRGGEYFQRQYQAGFDGRQTNLLGTKIDFVLGSGNHARAYLHRTAKNTLILLPLGWYAEKGGTWAMNPGYDRPDHQALRRNITYECMFCHNAYPEIPAGDRGPRATPVYSSVPEGIDCQRCHGNGDRHAALARGRASFDEIRAAIVNPARLAPERQMEVCMQCHLETTSSGLPASIVRYDRGPFSYHPGEPLGGFMLHFDHAPGRGYDDKFEITGSVYRLRKSQCFQKSGGALQCTTCHNPHKPLRGAEATAHYAEVCLKCHGAALETAIAAGRHTASNDCTGCHMPKRRTADVVHAVMTDHYIQRRPPAGDLLAEKPEERQTEANAYRGEVVLYDPPTLPKPEDELYVAVAQVSNASNLVPGIARLAAAIRQFRPASAEFYLQLGDGLCNAGKCGEALPVYQEALRHEPQSEPALVRLAVCLMTLRQYPRAAETLRDALRLEPADAATWIQLGLAQLGQGKTNDALSAFETARQADPAMVEPYNLLGSILFESGDAARAEPLLREAIRMQPNFAPAHNNLGNLLSETGRFEEARYHFEAALRYQENYSGARYNYALALTRVHRVDEARAQVETILRTNPNSAEAHEFLGNLYLARKEVDRAIGEYREAVRIQPEFDRANLDLGKALVGSGKPDAAYPYLQKAAQSRDAEIRDAARRIIEKH